jgi:SAM-dependent methyltransferase
MTVASSMFSASDGAAYELLMGRWSRRLAELFLDFSGTRPGEAVLDVGSGTGSLAFALARRIANGTIDGLDFSPAYVVYANRRNTDPRVSFRVGDACAMPFPDATFDRVLSLLVLHFVPEPERAVAEMRRVARPGATVAATVWDVRGGSVANRIFWDTAAVLDPKAAERRARLFTRPMALPGGLGRAWRAGGLADVEETSLTIRMEFASFDDYWTPYCGKQGPVAEYMETLDAGQRTRLQDHLRRAYLDGAPDGPRSYAATAWAVKGIAPGQRRTR